MPIISSIEELDRIRYECRSMVTRRSLASAGAAAIPIPGVDVSVDVALMVEIVKKVNRRFGLNPEQIESLDPDTRQRLIVLVTSVGSSIIGQYVKKEAVLVLLKRVGLSLGTASVAKYVPVIGTAVSSAVSFGAMKYLGDSHIDDCYKVMKEFIAGAS